MIPIPEPVLDRIIYRLQAGSADVAETIFDWTNIPVLREGFVFRLPRMSIEVARECSGIRSSIALLILAILVAHFSFSKFWKKAVFVTCRPVDDGCQERSQDRHPDDSGQLR